MVEIFARSKPIYIITVIALGLIFTLTISRLTEIPPEYITIFAIIFGFFIAETFSKLVQKLSDESRIEAKAEKLINNNTSSQKDHVLLVNEAINALKAPIIILDNELRLLHSNSAAASRFLANNIGARVENFIRNPEVLLAIKEVEQSGNSVDVIWETHYPNRKFERIHIARFAENESPRIILTCVDETILRAAERARADFLANAGHELRTPLVSIRGYLETIQDAAKDDKPAIERFIKVMISQADRMNRLINDILTLSKIELNEHVHPNLQLKLYPIIENAIAVSNVNAKKFDSKIVFEGSKNLEIIGDEDEVQQVLINLIDNALKYGNPKQTIKVIGKTNINRAEAARIATDSWENSNSLSICLPPIDENINYCLIRVENLGKGIEKRNMPRLSERFYRIDEASFSNEGTGLGLAIVKHIIMRHSGGFSVESLPNEKTAFSFFLPINIV